MSHTRVKTTYSIQGSYGSTETVELFCHHNHSSDFVTFYDDAEGKEVTSMFFAEWESDNDLWDAMKRLWYPFKIEWNKELKDGVEYWHPKKN